MSHAITARNFEIGSPIVAVDTMNGPRNVVLTFDDGPEPIGTNEVLSALHDAGATATFFVLLTRTAITPSLLGDMIAEGHEIALHGPDHRSLLGMSFKEVFTRTLEAKNELENLIGQPVSWFRPPYGNQSVDSWLGVIETGLQPVHWSVQCDDWRDPLDDDYEQFLGEVRKVEIPGAIVLAHDNYASQLIDNADLGVAPTFSRGRLAREILDDFGAKGFTCCSLRQALLTGGPIRNPWQFSA